MVACTVSRAFIGLNSQAEHLHSTVLVVKTRPCLVDTVDVLWAPETFRYGASAWPKVQITKKCKQVPKENVAKKEGTMFD